MHRTRCQQVCERCIRLCCCWTVRGALLWQLHTISLASLLLSSERCSNGGIQQYCLLLVSMPGLPLLAADAGGASLARPGIIADGASGAPAVLQLPDELLAPLTPLLHHLLHGAAAQQALQQDDGRLLGGAGGQRRGLGRGRTLCNGGSQCLRSSVKFARTCEEPPSATVSGGVMIQPKT